MNIVSASRSTRHIIWFFFELLALFFLSTMIVFGQPLNEGLIEIETAEATPVWVDDFNDNMTDPYMWNAYNLGEPTVNETNQQLEIEIPSTSSGEVYYAGYASRFRIRGDYDVEVAYSLPIWPMKSGVRLGLIANSLGFSPQRVSCGNGESCVDVYLVNNNDSLSTFLDASSHMEGKFRITRQEELVTGYYYDSDSMDWVQISSASLGTDDVKFSLQGWSHDSYFIHQDVSIAFDDFIVNEGQVIASEIFLPIAIK